MFTLAEQITSVSSGLTLRFVASEPQKHLGAGNRLRSSAVLNGPASLLSTRKVLSTGLIRRQPGRVVTNSEIARQVQDFEPDCKDSGLCLRMRRKCWPVRWIAR